MIGWRRIVERVVGEVRRRDARARRLLTAREWRLVQVLFARRLYVYRVRGPVGLGDVVEVRMPHAGRRRLIVCALGRGDWNGPVKTAKVIKRSRISRDSSAWSSGSW